MTLTLSNFQVDFLGSRTRKSLYKYSKDSVSCSFIEKDFYLRGDSININMDKFILIHTKYLVCWSGMRTKKK